MLYCVKHIKIVSFITLSEKWVSACKLKAGDKVLLSDGKYGIIISVKIEELEIPETTYNFEVADFHTYFVGENPVCVHNEKCGGDFKKYSSEEIARFIKWRLVMFNPEIQEPIIDEKTFETVQQMRKVKRARTKYNETNMFSGLLYCADCGNHLTIQRVARNRKMDNFSCATYRKKKKGLCSCHRILVSDLETIVKEDLQKVCEYVFLHEKEFTDEYLSGSKRETVKFQAKTKAELKRLCVLR